MAESSLQLRRSTRISQSNLHVTQTDASLDHQQDPSEQIIPTDTRNYIVNKNKSLAKKLDSCDKKHLTYELKAGNNLTLNYSTAAYELTRHKIDEILKSDTFLDQYEVTRENSKDKSGALMESRIKISNKRKDQNQKIYQKYSMNLYHTQSSMLINGRNLELFESDILSNIIQNIAHHHRDLDNANSCIGNIVKLAIQDNNGDHETTLVKTKIRQPQDHCHTQQICVATAAVVACNPDTEEHQTETEHKEHEGSNIEYSCPMCKSRPGPIRLHVTSATNGFTSSVLA